LIWQKIVILICVPDFVFFAFMQNSYFIEGIKHITDPSAYDHMLFLLALCAPYSLQQWKKLLLLVTAFTIGHCITLALATTNILSFSSQIIEVLIPVTIIATGVTNLISIKKNSTSRFTPFLYGLILIIGLVHGMGFSSYLKMMLDKEDSLFAALALFNIGIEVGQLAIILTVLFLFYLLEKTTLNMVFVRICTSLLTMVVAAFLLFQNLAN
jgi:hypothetical protein